MNLKFIIRIGQSLLLGFGLISLAACGDGMESGVSQTTSVPAASDSLSVTTFNTGLATGFVPYSAERKVKIIEALDNSDSDVICLQEVWSDTDRDEIITALSATYPNAYYDQTNQVAAGNPVSSCVDLGPDGVDAGLGIHVDAEFATMLGCLQTKCVPNSISISECISDANYCQDDFIPLYMTNQECVETLQANVGLSDNLTAYIGTSLVDDVDYAYNGRNGLLLLSRYQLNNTDSIDFIAGTNKRNALYARVTKGGVDHHLACTHLTANMGTSAVYTRAAYVNDSNAGVQTLGILQAIAGPGGYDTLHGGLDAVAATFSAKGYPASLYPQFETIAKNGGHYTDYVNGAFFPLFFPQSTSPADTAAAAGTVALKKGWEGYAALPASLRALLDVESIRTAISATGSVTDLLAIPAYGTDIYTIANLIYRSKGWETDNAVQIGSLIGQMTARAGNEPQYIAGDFNCSLDDAWNTIDGEFETGCGFFSANGYYDAIGVSTNAAPSFDAKNLVNLAKGSEHGSGNYLLDHVFTKNVFDNASQYADIVMNQQVSITDNGSTVTTNLSDHYGVKVVVPFR